MVALVGKYGSLGWKVLLFLALDDREVHQRSDDITDRAVVAASTKKYKTRKDNK